jgi:hypothetical protein
MAGKVMSVAPPAMALAKNTARKSGAEQKRPNTDIRRPPYQNHRAVRRL